MNIQQKHAKHYCARLGWGLVPLASGKRPLDPAWQNNPITDPDEAVRRFAGGQNMGVHLEASGLAILDIDHLEYATQAAAAVGIDLPALLAAAPVKIKGRNSKPLFRLPAGIQLGYAAISWPHPTERDQHGRPRRVSVLEFRAGPGRQDVLPPSIHPDTGAPYTWEGTPPRRLEDIPELPAALLSLWQNLPQTAEAMRRACPWQTEAAPVQQPRAAQPYAGESVIDAFNARYTVQEILERNGYKQRGGKYLSPHSSTKAAGVTLYSDGGKTRARTWHGSDSWNDGHGHDAFGLYAELEHGGDLRAATRAAAADLGMVRQQAEHRRRPAQHVKSDTAHPAIPAQLWAEYGPDVMSQCLDRLAEASGHSRTRQLYMDLLTALYAAIDSGELVERDGKCRIEFGGLERIAERMLYRGRLRDLRAALDNLTAQGFIGRVVSTNPNDRFAPLAVEVPADPRQMPILRFQGVINLMSASYTTQRRRHLKATPEQQRARRAPRQPRSDDNATPIHDARWVLYWIRQGCRSVEEVARRGRLSPRTVRKHLKTLEAVGLVVDWAAAAHNTAWAMMRAEVENTPAYRASRVRYLEEAARFGHNGAQAARRAGATRMEGRRQRTNCLAVERLNRLRDGESCAAVFGVDA